MDLMYGECSEALFEPISPKALERACQDAEATGAAELKAQQSSAEPPLSPIVGYGINSDDDEVVSDSSSENDPETDRCLAQVNAQLAKIVGRELIPEPNTPRSALRKRLRKRRTRTQQKMENEAEPKRPKIMNEDDHAHEEVEPASSNPIVEFADTLPPFVGFRTAAGKPLAISEAALKKAQILFKEIESAMDQEAKIGNKSSQAEFSTPNFPDTAPGNSSSFVGFKTASGKPVAVSEAAMKRAQALFTEIDSEMARDTTESVDTPNAAKTVKNGLSAVRRSPRVLFKPPTPLNSRTGKIPGKGYDVARTAKENMEAAAAAGMTQEVEECIAAFLADDDEASPFETE